MISFSFSGTLAFSGLLVKFRGFLLEMFHYEVPYNVRGSLSVG